MNYVPRQNPTADRLLADHATSADLFFTMVREFQARFKAMDWPLGSPSQHFELDDIDSALADMLEATTPETLQWVANDIVAENEFLAGQTRNDERRDLAGK